jgi:hypothetical protein
MLLLPWSDRSGGGRVLMVKDTLIYKWQHSFLIFILFPIELEGGKHVSLLLCTSYSVLNCTDMNVHTKFSSKVDECLVHNYLGIYSYTRINILEYVHIFINTHLCLYIWLAQSCDKTQKVREARRKTNVIIGNEPRRLMRTDPEESIFAPHKAKRIILLIKNCKSLLSKWKTKQNKVSNKMSGKFCHPKLNVVTVRWQRPRVAMYFRIHRRGGWTMRWPQGIDAS